MTPALGELQERLGVRFADEGLLLLALTHPSWSEEHGGGNYQRLEFLGDSVLGFVVASEVYARFPDRPEGDLTRMKWALVSGVTLAQVGRELGLDSAIMCGRGAASSVRRDSVLEACFEAVVGAVFLDAGMEAARGLVLRSLGDRLDPDTLPSAAVRNPKGELQELAQSRMMGLPKYVIASSEGPAHDPRFVSTVTLGDEILGSGSGTTKQAAQQAAAADALAALRTRLDERRKRAR